MKTTLLAALITVSLAPIHASATEHSSDTPVSDEVIIHERDALAAHTKDQGFGPQSPRDIDSNTGSNSTISSPAPASSAMNLCNIHFHKNAEHKGGEFTKYAGNGDGLGYQSGYKFSGQLTAKELTPLNEQMCPSKHGGLSAGDTIEVHYVYSSIQVAPGPTLGACLSDKINNPQLRVETQVYVVVNDKNALDFAELTKHGVKNGKHQAFNIPSNTGTPIQYEGSTTGPDFDEVASPFLATWSVRPKVAKVNIETVGKWCQGNVFNEDHAHGVRNLIKNPDLLSQMTK
ncbi:hypothetical protein HQQ94_17735 [Shewanella sp. VB17]|uniref:delta-class carbonic anhydrase n=1 Tax=Shewanella sp. VB17 TaxID=2739432 RepID=UPI00156542F4|nr:delta-class carbonic anhydrase [Shewanella sp. VB17]NRD75023.1 hypothetical protein [Shewanella sp. VB17]